MTINGQFGTGRDALIKQRTWLLQGKSKRKTEYRKLQWGEDCRRGC